MNKPPFFPQAPNEYSADQINQFERVLTQYLNQSAADVNAADLTAAEKNAAIAQMSSCLVSGCALSINAGDNTKFDIAPGTIRYADSYTDPLNATFLEYVYPGASAVTVTNLATQSSTYVSLYLGGVIHQDAVKHSGSDLRDHVLLGALVHTNHTSITSADSLTDVVGMSLASSLADISLAIGPINSGNAYSGNVTNTMRLDKSAGTFTQLGVNWKNDKQNPNILTAPASSGATYLTTWRNGSGGWTTTTATDISPNYYDDGTGGATHPNGSVSSNKWTLKRIYYLPNSQLTAVEYGQVVYADLATAVAAKSVVTASNPALASVPFRGWLAVKSAATNLNDPATAMFIDSGKFGLTT
jgi:hypothetical protein